VLQRKYQKKARIAIRKYLDDQGIFNLRWAVDAARVYMKGLPGFDERGHPVETFSKDCRIVTDTFTFYTRAFGDDIQCVRVMPDIDLPAVIYETEVKTGWTDFWPASRDTIHIPGRKEHFLDKKGFFVVMNESCTQAWFIRFEDVTTDMLQMVSNRLVQEGEMMFDVPIEKAKLINL
jgi:hypothetical protein